MQHIRQGGYDGRGGCVAIAMVVFGLLVAATVRAEGPAVRVTAHSSLQTFRAEEAPSGAVSEIRLSAARGEAESFQLAVANGSPQALRDIRVTVSGLGDVAATVYAEAAVQVAKPGRSGGAPAGHYFDLLRPAGSESIEPGKYQPYWIDLKVADGAAAGVREGRVSVASAAGTQSVPIRFQVRGFQLPAVPSLKLAFACGLNWMAAYYGKPLTPAQVRGVQEVMLQHRLGPVPMWGAGKELFDDESRMKDCLAQGMNVVLLTCGGSTDEQIDRSLGVLEPKIAMLRRLGALDRTYLFGYDEITMSAPEQIPAMRKAYERFHERHPEIRRINTSQPDERLKGFVDIFVVPTSRFVTTMGEGNEVWWYSVGADNLGNEPDFRIDFPAMAQREFFLADWKAGVTGHLYWAVQREWPANKDIRDKNRPEHEWRTGYHHASSNAWVEDNGGGNLFYPDPAVGLLPTPRVKRIRDGIEDYEYLAQLQKAAAELARRKPRGGDKLLGLVRGLLTVPDQLVRVGGGWSEGWRVTGGNCGACSLTTHPRAVHGGRQALRIVPDPTGVTLAQELPARPGKAAVFSGWLKTDDLTGEACLTAEYRDVQGRTIQRFRSQSVSGSSKKFLKSELAVAPAPSEAATLRVGLVARAKTLSTDAKAPLQKAFFDDLTLRVGDAAVPLVNAGFESERLRLGNDPAALAAYREGVAECLEQCVSALR
jgi:hypothetical protein